MSFGTCTQLYVNAAIKTTRTQWTLTIEEIFKVNFAIFWEEKRILQNIIQGQLQLFQVY